MPETFAAEAPDTEDTGHLDRPTRAAALKWVMVVDDSLPAGLAANAAACMAAAVGQRAPELLGPDGADGSGRPHVGLPWIGCAVLAADAATLRELRDRAVRKDGLLVVDMPRHAQATTIYGEYLATLADTTGEDLDYLAVSLVGPRNPVSKLVKRLPLLK